jgi:hypothetical protein
MDQIIPSASLAEVDAAMDQQVSRAPEPAQFAAKTPEAPAADFEELAEPEKEVLPRPAPVTATARPMPPLSPPPTPANRMEQVEMFERKPEAPSAEEGQARPRDSRAESIAKAQHIARSLGVSSLTDDEYDIPTFIRRQQQNNSTLN